MKNYQKPEPTVLVIFGAGGDLTWRKLVPSLFDLFQDEWLPQHFSIVGVDRKEMGEEAFRAQLREGVEQFARHEVTDEGWQSFAARLSYLSADFASPATYQTLQEHVAACEAEWGSPTQRLFYLATPPSVVSLLVTQLGAAGLHEPRERVRLVIEKPFGRDLESARALNQELTQVFHESQIFRIDHYLGKVTVQNLLAFRFANLFFEPLWDRRYIDHVQITVAEEVGIGHRGGYYDKSGALRDMLQNHLMQLLTLIAMEPMVSFRADEIRDKTLDVLQAVRPIPPDEVDRFVVRGQYAAGEVGGEAVRGYHEEADIPADSATESFVALKLYIDNWRWHGVPFYLRTGKRLARKDSEIVIQLRPVPHRAFPPAMVEKWSANRLVIHLQPTEGMDLCFQVREPGVKLKLEQAGMEFRYAENFQEPIPEAYETLLLDVMLGDATLFMRADQVEAAWTIVQPILDHWATQPADLPTYPAGSWGPAAAAELIRRDKRRWVEPE